MKYNFLYGILMVFGMDVLLTTVFGSLEMDISKKLEENGTILSRKRRYLVFPEGSSFQVVFDLTYPSVGMGNAFVFGNTAAMGFELPSKPIFLDEKKMSKEDEEKPENKPTEKVPENLEHPVNYQQNWQPSMTYLHDTLGSSQEWQHSDDFVPTNFDSSYDSAWANIDRSPVTFYSNPFENHVNQKLPPQQQLTSVGEVYSKYGNLNRPSTFWNLPRIYQNNRRLSPLRNSPMRLFDNSMTPFRKTVTHHIHRRSRREIYTKIEKFFTALSKDGKACILKTICQVNKIPKSKGSMWEEILKAIFMVKPNGIYPDEDHYDEAADIKHDCDKMYPECDGYVLGKIFRKTIKK